MQQCFAIQQLIIQFHALVLVPLQREELQASLPAYYLEQVGTSPTTNFNDVFDHDGDVRNNPSPTVRVEIGGGTQLNFEYVFPITSIGSAAGSLCSKYVRQHCCGYKYVNQMIRLYNRYFDQPNFSHC